MAIQYRSARVQREAVPAPQVVHAWANLGLGLVWLAAQGFLLFQPRRRASLDRAVSAWKGRVEIDRQSVQDHSVQPTLMTLLRFENWLPPLVHFSLATIVWWVLQYFGVVPVGVTSDQSWLGMNIGSLVSAILVGILVGVLSWGVHLWLGMRDDFLAQVMQQRGDDAPVEKIVALPLADWRF